MRKVSVKTKIARGKSLEVLRQGIASLEEEEQLVIRSRGAFSAYHILEAMCELAGASKVMLTSWAFSKNACEALRKLKADGLITELHILSDHRLRSTHPEEMNMLSDIADTLVLGMNHSKNISVISDNTGFTSLGSGNQTNNPRLESYTIYRHKKLAEDCFNDDYEELLHYQRRAKKSHH